jgi:septum formation protein
MHPADTVVLTRDDAITSGYQTSGLGPDILEKPETREENLRMLMELNGKSCEVVTGVTVCKHPHCLVIQVAYISLVFPIVTAPGYKLQ